ncbi:MAG: hypothetical protein HZB83_04075 [Deltaproteobacteria bacterium]|nr:hypothetical protein [Deltaproteobacteria bacterium]
MPYKKAKSDMKGMTVVYSGDSSVLVKKNGTLAWRNSNPGNIKCGSFTKSQGAIGCNKGFAIFPDADTGRKAQNALLKIAKYQNKTVDEAMKSYAPPTENDTERYIQYITKKTGLSRSKKLGDMNPQEFDKFAGAIRRYEDMTHGTEATLPHPDRISHLLRSPRGSSYGSSSGRTLKRVGGTVYRVEEGRIAGSFTCHGRKR